MTDLMTTLQTVLAPIVGADKICTIDSPKDIKPPYIVLTPVDDPYSSFADDKPQRWTEEVQISIFTIVNYNVTAEAVCNACLSAGCTITERGFIEKEDKTRYFHYGITVEKEFEVNEWQE